MRSLLAALIPALLACAASCGKGAEPVRVVMKNETGGHMRNFDLDTGSGRIQYQIFSKDYTFSKELVFERAFRPALSYTDDAGLAVSREFDVEFGPQHNGGVIRITFDDRGGQQVDIERMRRPEAKDSLEENVADARRWYDALEIGMSGAEAGEITGTDPGEHRRYTWSLMFGMHGTETYVRLNVYLVDGKVMRVEIFSPHPSEKLGEVLEEKGFPRDKVTGP